MPERRGTEPNGGNQDAPVNRVEQTPVSLAPASAEKTVPGDKKALKPPPPPQDTFSVKFDDIVSGVLIKLDDMKRELEDLKAERVRIQKENADYINQIVRQTEEELRELKLKADEAQKRRSTTKRLIILRQMQKDWDNETSLLLLIHQTDIPGHFREFENKIKRVQEIEGEIKGKETFIIDLSSQAEKLKPLIAEEATIKEHVHGFARQEEMASRAAELMHDLGLFQLRLENEQAEFAAVMNEISSIGERILRIEQTEDHGESNIFTERTEVALEREQALNKFKELRTESKVESINVQDLLHASQQSIKPAWRRALLMGSLCVGLRDEQLIKGVRAQLAPSPEAKLKITENEAKNILTAAVDGAAVIPEDIWKEMLEFKKKEWFKTKASTYFMVLIVEAGEPQSTMAWTKVAPTLGKETRGIVATALTESLGKNSSFSDRQLSGLQSVRQEEKFVDIHNFKLTNNLPNLEGLYDPFEIACLYAHSFAVFEGGELEHDDPDRPAIETLSWRLAAVQNYLSDEYLRISPRRVKQAKRGKEKIQSAIQSVFEGQLLSGRDAASYLKLNNFLDTDLSFPAWAAENRGEEQQRSYKEAKEIQSQYHYTNLNRLLKDIKRIVISSRSERREFGFSSEWFAEKCSIKQRVGSELAAILIVEEAAHQIDRYYRDSFSSYFDDKEKRKWKESHGGRKYFSKAVNILVSVFMDAGFFNVAADLAAYLDRRSSYDVFAHARDVWDDKVEIPIRDYSDQELLSFSKAFEKICERVQYGRDGIFFQLIEEFGKRNNIKARYHFIELRGRFLRRD